VTTLVGQLLASSAQWTVVLFAPHMSLGVELLAIVQPFGSALHVQAAAPGAPVQVWFAAQATGVSPKRQFLEFEVSVVHVEMVPLVGQYFVPAPALHSAGGAEQSHAPVGLLPLHSWCAGQGFVLTT
jgi:hypothetical protein